MLLNLKDKKKIVLELKNNLNKSLSIILIGFKNISCNNLNNLRKKMYNINSFLVVLRNNLLKFAVKDTEISFLSNYLIGPTIICYSYDIISNFLKLLNIYFNKFKDKLFLRAIVINKKLISLNLSKKLIKLNTINKSLIYFISYLKNISILKFLRVLINIKNCIK